MVGRRSTQNSSLSDRIGMNARINKVKCSIDEAVREDAEWEELWQLTFHGDKVFSQSLENEDYAGLLLKTFQFIDEVTDNKDWNRTCRTFSEKKERLLFPPNDCIKSTMASTARGNSLSESLDWSFNCQ